MSHLSGSTGDGHQVISIMLVILLFEWAGGLSSVVALTDAIQGKKVVFSFIALPTINHEKNAPLVDGTTRNPTHISLT
jgi:hypothetical protein